MELPRTTNANHDEDLLSIPDDDEAAQLLELESKLLTTTKRTAQHPPPPLLPGTNHTPSRLLPSNLPSSRQASTAVHTYLKSGELGLAQSTPTRFAPPLRMAPPSAGTYSTTYKVTAHEHVQANPPQLAAHVGSRRSIPQTTLPTMLPPPSYKQPSTVAGHTDEMAETITSNGEHGGTSGPAWAHRRPVDQTSAALAVENLNTRDTAAIYSPRNMYRPSSSTTAIKMEESQRLGNMYSATRLPLHLSADSANKMDDSQDLDLPHSAARPSLHFATDSANKIDDSQDLDLPHSAARPPLHFAGVSTSIIDVSHNPDSQYSATRSQLQHYTEHTQKMDYTQRRPYFDRDAFPESLVLGLDEQWDQTYTNTLSTMLKKAEMTPQYKHTQVPSYVAPQYTLPQQHNAGFDYEESQYLSNRIPDMSVDLANLPPTNFITGSHRRKLEGGEVNAAKRAKTDEASRSRPEHLAEPWTKEMINKLPRIVKECVGEDGYWDKRKILAQKHVKCYGTCGGIFANYIEVALHSMARIASLELGQKLKGIAEVNRYTFRGGGSKAIKQAQALCRP